MRPAVRRTSTDAANTGSTARTVILGPAPLLPRIPDDDAPVGATRLARSGSRRPIGPSGQPSSPGPTIGRLFPLERAGGNRRRRRCTTHRGTDCARTRTGRAAPPVRLRTRSLGRAGRAISPIQAPSRGAPSGGAAGCLWIWAMRSSTRLNRHPLGCIIPGGHRHARRLDTRRRRHRPRGRSLRPERRRRGPVRGRRHLHPRRPAAAAALVSAVPPTGHRRPDVAADLRGDPSLGAGDSRPRRRPADAAVAPRSQHRRVRRRPVVERRRDRHHRRVGHSRRATGQSGRRAAAARVRGAGRVDLRRARPDRPDGEGLRDSRPRAPTSTRPRSSIRG